MERLDTQLDTALAARLIIATFAFLAFSQRNMVIPGYVALAAVALTMFHIFVGGKVCRKHLYIAAMTTWGSAAICVAVNNQFAAYIALFVCLYIYELFVFIRWGFTDA